MCSSDLDEDRGSKEATSEGYGRPLEKVGDTREGKTREGDKFFRDRVLYDANLAKEKAEEEEETTSKCKDKGKGPSCTQ